MKKMAEANVITVDGVEYVRKPTSSEDVRIVILQRGWVMVGQWSQDGEMCSLDNANVIRIWGTTKGLGQLVGGPLPSTKMDPAGHVEFHILTVIASIRAKADKWEL
jgi:hypothetical protein